MCLAHARGLRRLLGGAADLCGAEGVDARRWPDDLWAGASERTVYADPQVNFAFRAWHDWCHWKGDYDLTIDGEAAASSMQCRLLVARYGNGDLTLRWSAIIDAEINGQAQYHASHQRFPDDQRGFVDAYLDNPAAALRCPAW